MVKSGFTLIELMVAVLIIGVLLSIGFPSYLKQLEYGYRTDAQRILYAEANRLERIYAANGVYPSSLTVEQTTRYDLTYQVGTSATTFILSAKPKSKSDSCGTLTLNQSGATTPTTQGCWP